jgi:hypothetical protein
LFWKTYGWAGVVMFLGALLAMALALGLHLTRLQPLEAAQRI